MTTKNKFPDKVELTNTTDSYRNIEILRKSEVIQMTKISNTGIFERTKDGLFPTSLSLGGRSIGYIKSEITALLTARAAGRTDEQIKELITLMIAKRKEQADAFLAALVA
ncbi:MAG: prophage regulatory protein [Glaciecola sp.]|jgi:prophage regulatory protein